MRCPVDRHPLTPQAIGDATYAICGECAGLWLTRKALEPPSIDPASLPAKSRQGRARSRPRRKIRACPECARHLYAESIEGVEIDRCVHCVGVWLDAGEYDAVRKRLELGGHDGGQRQSGSKIDWLDGGFEMMTGLIELIFFW